MNAESNAKDRADIVTGLFDWIDSLINVTAERQTDADPVDVTGTW